MDSSHWEPPWPVIENDVLVGAIDWLGNRFGPGDRVVYCMWSTLRTRLVVMAAGQVTELKLDPDRERVKVRVLTLRQSLRDVRTRRESWWVNGFNVTALPRLKESIESL